MYGKGKSNSSVPSDSQAREKLALYVYEYLLHVGAQKSAQTFLSEIRWEKNITLGEPPGFLHSWWCVFWDLYCAAPERRETCEHSSEAKAFHDYPFMSPRYPGGPRPPLRIPNQALGGVPGSQPLLPSGMDPTRQQGHPNMGGPMQRMTPPRGMVPLGPQNYGGAMRPPLNALGGPGMPGMNMGPGGGRPWPNPTNANSIPYSSASPGNYVGPPGGGGPPGTPIMPSPADSTNSGDNMYTLMNAVPPGPNRSNFPMGPGSDGPMGGLGGMESHHMNGSLGSGDMDSISKGMKDRGHNRDPKQCRVKLKELRQAYQKTREANSRSGSEPQTCRFYDELHAILGGSATTTPAVLFDSFNGDGGNTEVGFGDEEDDEEEVVDSSQQASGETGFPDSQELFLTLDLEPVPPRTHPRLPPGLSRRRRDLCCMCFNDHRIFSFPEASEA
nr:single-stranded DNA-binding protein 2 isoform X2 [Caretta caretta]